MPLAGICIAGAILRCIYFAQTDSIPFLHNLVGDAAGYWAWGSRIATGEWLGEESFYQAPLYPYLLSLVFKVIGESVWGVRIVQAGISSIAVAVLGSATSRLFGRGVGMIAAAMAALYAPAFFFDGIVQKESLAASLVCFLFAFLVRFGYRPSFLKSLAIGLLLGLLALVRENTQLWIPIILLWIWRVGIRVPNTALVAVGLSDLDSKADRGSANDLANGSKASSSVSTSDGNSTRNNAKIVALLIGCLLGCTTVLGPVAFRNKLIGGEWSISTFQAGPNFYIGNSTEADGRYRPLVRGHETPAFERRDATMLAEQAEGRDLTPREVSRFWFRRGLADIANDPPRWMRLMALKLAMVFNDYEVTDAESQYVYADYSLMLRSLQNVWRFGVLFPLAMVGLWMTRVRWREMWVYYALIVSFAFSVALFYVLARYRFPMVPLLVAFAAAGVVELVRVLREHRWRNLATAIAAGALATTLAYWPVHDRGRLDALARMNLGVALAQSGDIPSALDQFAKVVEGHPTSAEANMNLAQALAVSGRFADAIPYYHQALAADPGLLGVEYNLAVALEQIGQTEEALAMYRRAVERDVSDAEARAAVERLQRGAK